MTLLKSYHHWCYFDTPNYRTDRLYTHNFVGLVNVASKIFSESTRLTDIKMIYDWFYIKGYAGQFCLCIRDKYHTVLFRLVYKIHHLALSKVKNVKVYLKKCHSFWAFD